MTDFAGLFMLRDLPKRPNGESVYLPPRHRGIDHTTHNLKKDLQEAKDKEVFGQKLKRKRK